MFLHIHNHSKCKQIEFMNLKAESGWMDRYKSKIQLNTAYKRLISVLRHTYAQSKGIKEIPCNWKQKESHDSHTDSRQSRLKAKNGDIFNEGYYLIIKGSIHQEDIRVKNI